MKREPSAIRRERQLDTRRRLFQATLDEIALHAYQNTTIDQIVARAETGRATFYLHFEGKSDALIAGWQEIHLPEVIALLTDLDAAPQPTIYDVAAWVERMLRYWEGNRNVVIASKQAMALDPRLAEAWFEAVYRALISLPNWRARHGDSERAQGRLFALGVQLDHLLFMWIMGASPLTRDVLVSSLSDLWFSEFGQHR